MLHLYPPPCSCASRPARMAALALLALALMGVAPAEAASRDRTPADGRCEWRNPGADKYTRPLADALQRLDVIPQDVRARLAARLNDPRKVHNADDHMLVTGTGAEGERAYYSLHDMNGGDGAVCWGEVTRESWAPLHAERALVFCEGGYCVAYFSVCRNIARAVVTQPKPQGSLTGGPMTVEPPPIEATAMVLGPVDLPEPRLAHTLMAVPGASDEGLLDSASSWETVAQWEAWRPVLPPLWRLSTVPSTTTLAPGRFTPVPGVTPVVEGPKGLTPGDVPTNIGDITAPIPEPGTWALMLLGLGLLMGARRVMGDRVSDQCR